LHEQTYGYGVPDDPVEIVNLGLSAIGRIRKPRLKEIRRGTASADDALKRLRRVYFDALDGSVDCPVFDRYALASGNVIPGPAIIEETDSTTVVYPGYAAEVVEFGTLLVTAGHG
jgi:N-methylhydantoinase A